MNQPITFAAHDFTVEDFEEKRMPFDPAHYSYLKFGCDRTAKLFGWTLADRFFAAHRDLLLSNRCVLLPSAYNYVPNAAMVMTEHLIARLNHLVVEAGGHSVEFSLIRRKLTFTIDYGFLSKEERVALLTQDQMFMNESYLRGKTLIFVDDIRITGTNELCMKSLIEANPSLSDSQVVYLYFAQLIGEIKPSIEAALNLSSINTLPDYIKLSETPKHHVIARPIKFAMSRPGPEFRAFIALANPEKLLEIYYGCIGEGYYHADGFKENFAALRAFLHNRGYFSIDGDRPGTIMNMVG
jgi:hypothetical protein